MLTYAALSSNLWERAGFEPAAARDEIVVLSGAKDLWNFFPAHEAKNPEVFECPGLMLRISLQCFAQHSNAQRRILSCAAFILRASLGD
jgi:hypothetical protein